MALNSRLACGICLDQIDSNLIVSVDTCGHRFCSNCLKRHIEVMLLNGKLPTCSQARCKSQLSIDRYGKLLTSKLSLMWKQNSIPLRDRFYCPYKKCSYLMSKTDLSSSSSVESGLRRCLKCSGSFCIHCKVPWHNTQSCRDYKKLHPNPKNDDDDDAKLKSLAKLKGCGNRICCVCGGELDKNFHLQCIITRVGATFPGGFNGLRVVFIMSFMYTLFNNGPNRQGTSETVQKREINTDESFSTFLFAFL